MYTIHNKFNQDLTESIISKMTKVMIWKFHVAFEITDSIIIHLAKIVTHFFV